MIPVEVANLNKCLYFFEFWIFHYEKIMRFSLWKIGEYNKWALFWDQYLWLSAIPWKLPFMYWNQQTADYSVHDCSNLDFNREFSVQFSMYFHPKGERNKTWFQPLFNILLQPTIHCGCQKFRVLGIYNFGSNLQVVCRQHCLDLE